MTKIVHLYRTKSENLANTPQNCLAAQPSSRNTMPLSGKQEDIRMKVAQVYDWTSTLTRLDCTILLCWMLAYT